MRYRFGDFELDAGHGVLRRAGVEVELRPKLVALLSHLVRQAGRVVPKDEVLETIWPGVHVSEATLASTLRDLRRALEDTGEAPRFVQTLWGRGIRFVAAVEATPDGVRSGAARAAGAAASYTFVGREDVLASAGRLVDALFEGRGGTMLLVGEAGIGKSRTALEIARRARERGAVLHLGRCLEEAGAPAYWPWVQVLRSARREGLLPEPDASAAMREAARLLPELRLAPEPAQGVAEDGEIARFRLFDAVTQLVLTGARARPAILILDDLHRAEPSSALLLRHLAREAPSAPVLVLGTYRDAELPAGHPLEALVAELHPHGERIALRGLDESEVALLIERCAGISPSAELAATVHGRTGGNPLFVEHVVRSLAADTALDAPDAASLAARALPVPVTAVIRDGVGRLPGRAAAVLSRAAVIGRDFDLDLLEAVCEGIAPGEVRDALDAAAAAGLLSDAAGGAARFRFTHVLVRDALYGALSTQQRIELHADVGNALERLRGHDLGAVTDELAHHFGEAAAGGDTERARRYARRAGERALSRAAYPEAARRLEAALQALALESAGGSSSEAEERTRLRERADLLVLRGQALWRSGVSGEARESFAEAFTLARIAGDPEILARAALGFVGRTDVTPGVNHEAVGMLEAALAALPAGDSALRAELLARLGTELYYQDLRGRTDALTSEAVGMAERVGDPRLLGYVLSARSFALMRPDVSPHSRLALLERTASLAEKTGALDVLAIARQEILAAQLETGDLTRFDITLRRHQKVVDEARQPFFRWVLTFLTQTRTFLAGRLDDAEQLAQEALALGQSLGTPNAVPLFGVQLYVLRRERGGLGDLAPLFQRVIDENPVFGAYRCGLAEALLALGRREDARALFEQVMVDDLEDFPRDKDWPASLGVIAPVCVALGDARRARLLYDAFAPLAGRWIVVAHGGACFGAVDHHMARLAATFGDVELALGHFEEAAAAMRRARTPLFLAHALREWAGALWKSGAPHERHQARALAEEAAAGYSSVGLAHHAEAALDLSHAP